MSEHKIQQEILLALGSMPGVCKIWRQNTGSARSFDGKRTVKFGVSGGADISGILIDGRRLEIEIKTEIGHQSEQQRAFQEMIEKYGGAYILARSVSDAIAGVRMALDGQ